MASDDLLKTIFEHQLLLSQEMKNRLKAHMTETLKILFEKNEAYLAELLGQEVVTSENLGKLQRLWEDLTEAIGKITKDNTGAINVVNSQHSVAKLYQ